MKKLHKSIIIMAASLCLALSACTGFQMPTLQPTTTPVPQNMPNPASVYCEQQGNRLEIRTAEDGSQSGVCIFPDGSTCDEWAYFRGECLAQPQENPKLTQTSEPIPEASGGYMQPGTSEPIENWWGLIKSTPQGAQYDDYFERQDLGGSIFFGIDSADPNVQAQIVSLRDSGKIVHLYGTLFSNVPDYNGSQVKVDRIEVEGE